MRKFKISALGDVMMGVCSNTRTAYINLLPIRIKEKYYNVEQLSNLTADSDIVMANLESAITQNVVYARNYKHLVAPLEGLDFLKELNINLVSLANNHTFDYGEQILRETQELLDQNGIQWIHSPYFNKPSLSKEINGMQLSVVGYGAKPYYNVETDTIDPDYYKNWSFFKKAVQNLDKHDSFDWLSRGNLKPLIKEVSYLQEKSDYLIVFIHWGFANTRLPSPIQIEIGHKLIDIGADAVIGHHPHVIQPVEQYKGKIIAYSLGNLLFDSWKPDKKRSLIVNLSGNNNSVNAEYYLSDRDETYRYMVKELPMIQTRLKIDESELIFYYPEFLKNDINNAERILSSYYEYSKYRFRKRNTKTTEELKMLWDANFSIRTKINLLFNKLF